MILDQILFRRLGSWRPWIWNLIQVFFFLFWVWYMRVSCFVFIIIIYLLSLDYWALWYSSSLWCYDNLALCACWNAEIWITRPHSLILYCLLHWNFALHLKAALLWMRFVVRNNIFIINYTWKALSITIPMIITNYLNSLFKYNRRFWILTRVLAGVTRPP